MYGAMYECTAPGCGLRFPAALDAPRATACPVCAAPTKSSPLAGASPAQRLPPPGDDPSSAGRPGLALLLDNVRSAYNVGSIFRTADGAGVRHIYLCGICPTPQNPRVAKTALGAERTVAWSHHPNGARLARELTAELTAETGQLWALENCPSARSLYALPPPDGPRTLVLGSERFGVDPALLAQCAGASCLPMAGAKRSLNVASAAAIAIYHLRFAPATRTHRSQK